MGAANHAPSDGRIGVLFVMDSFPGPKAGTEAQLWLLLSRLDRGRFRPAILMLERSAWLDEHLPDVPKFVVGRAAHALDEVLDGGVASHPEGTRRRLFGCACLVQRLRHRLADSAAHGRVPRDRLETRPRNLVHAGKSSAAANECALRGPCGVQCGSRKAVGHPARGIPGLECAGDLQRHCQVRHRIPTAKISDVQHGIPAEATLVCIVANLRPLKRIVDAVEALALLARSEVERAPRDRGRGSGRRSGLATCRTRSTRQESRHVRIVSTSLARWRIRCR